MKAECQNVSANALKSSEEELFYTQIAFGLFTFVLVTALAFMCFILQRLRVTIEGAQSQINALAEIKMQKNEASYENFP